VERAPIESCVSLEAIRRLAPAVETRALALYAAVA